MNSGAGARGHWRELSADFDEVLGRLPEALKKEGFGVITEIDLQATFKAKLGVEVRPYRILGACNPAFAQRAVQQDEKLGLLLPCNVVLYEDAHGKTVVGIVDARQTLGADHPNAALAEIAREVDDRLVRVLAAL